MHSTDLENLYNKIEGHILLIGAYTNDASLIKIIKSCRLKPYSIFTNGFIPGTRFEKHWVDEFGNSLLFDNKTSRIIMNDTHIIDHTKISTDLFFGNSINATAKNSKFALVARGKHFEKDIYVVALYGQDEYLRAFIYNGKWSRISPLLLGLDALRELFKNIDSPWITEIDKRRLDFSLHFDVDKCITTSLPPKQSMVLYFDNEIITNSIL